MMNTQLILLVAWVFPLLLALVLRLFLRRRRAVASAFGDPEMMVRLIGTDLRRTPWRSMILVAPAGLALAAAIHLATIQRDESAAPGPGSAVVLILDASNSMLADDLQPTRMEAQRQAAREIIAAIGDRPAGIVIFAGRAYTLVPPTHDRAALEMYLEALDPEMVTQTGSSVAAAIRQGVSLILAADETAPGGTLVLISDGDDPGDLVGLQETLEIAGRAGVVIHTLGAATVAGAAVPLPRTADAELALIEQPADTVIISRLDEVLLRNIADQTGGIYQQLTDSPGEGVVAARIQSAAGRGDASSHDYIWPASLALLLLTTHAGWSHRAEGKS
ncbi:VWA domain-containing protein [soil metagenome]